MAHRISWLGFGPPKISRPSPAFLSATNTIFTDSLPTTRRIIDPHQEQPEHLTRQPSQACITGHWQTVKANSFFRDSLCEKRSLLEESLKAPPAPIIATSMQVLVAMSLMQHGFTASSQRPPWFCYHNVKAWPPFSALRAFFLFIIHPLFFLVCCRFCYQHVTPASLSLLVSWSRLCDGERFLTISNSLAIMSLRSRRCFSLRYIYCSQIQHLCVQ